MQISPRLPSARAGQGCWKAPIPPTSRVSSHSRPSDEGEPPRTGTQQGTSPVPTAGLRLLTPATRHTAGQLLVASLPRWLTTQKEEGAPPPFPPLCHKYIYISSTHPRAPCRAAPLSPPARHGRGCPEGGKKGGEAGQPRHAGAAPY